jgi:hypothetical protein
MCLVICDNICDICDICDCHICDICDNICVLSYVDFRMLGGGLPAAVLAVAVVAAQLW